MVDRAGKSWLVGVMAALLLFTQYAQCDDLPLEPAGCAVHCLQQDQAASPLDQAIGFVPLPLAHERVAFTLVPTQAAPAARIQSSLPPGPPLQVLYCSYLH